jgi:2-dehydro-3-deoxyphosphogluconate aldolase/(4S)-4-hydroxy-2-oxoglutarate aldolase
MIDLGRHAVVWSLPAVDADDLVAACEVLWQEGHRTWTLPVSRLAELAALRSLFGRRARLGIERAGTGDDAAAAASAGAAFVAASYALPEVVAGAGGLPVVLGGLTPTELRAAHLAGADAVQVTPCEAFGSLYTRALPGLVAPVPLLERYQAEQWLAAGAIGVWPVDLLTADLVVDTGLGPLRELCQRWQL